MALLPFGGRPGGLPEAIADAAPGAGLVLAVMAVSVSVTKVILRLRPELAKPVRQADELMVASAGSLAGYLLPALMGSKHGSCTSMTLIAVPFPTVIIVSDVKEIEAETLNDISNEAAHLVQGLKRLVFCFKNAKCGVAADIGVDGAALTIKYLDVPLKASPRVVVSDNKPALEFTFIGQTAGERRPVWQFYLVKVDLENFALSRTPNTDAASLICNADGPDVASNIARLACEALIASPLLKPQPI